MQLCFKLHCKTRGMFVWYETKYVSTNDDANRTKHKIANLSGNCHSYSVSFKIYQNLSVCGG